MSNEQTQHEMRNNLALDMIALAYCYGMRAEWHDDGVGGYYVVSGTLTVGAGAYGRLVDGARAYLDAAAAGRGGASPVL